MFREKKISLKMESFPAEEEQKLLLHSAVEIRNILQSISQHKTQCALYYDAGRNFYLTMLLDANEKGIWLDPPSHPTTSRRILANRELVIVSSDNQTKIQFSAADPYWVTYENREAIFLPLPQQMLRLQRRDCYRLATWPQHPVKCVLKPARNQARIVRVADISEEGIALEYPENELRLIPGTIYPDCEIALPEIGTLTATLEVKNSLEISTPSGKPYRRTGCAFVKPDRNTTLPLQRYVAQMQRISAMSMQR